MKKYIAIISSFLLIGCSNIGYKPIAKYSNKIFNQPIITNVKIDPEDPYTGVYLYDEITNMIKNRLNLKITKNVKEVNNYILVNRYTTTTTPTTSDDNGYTIRYTLNVVIELAIKDKYGFWSKNIIITEHVASEDNLSISQVTKNNAIKLAIKKAINNFLIAIVKRARDKTQKE